MNYHATNQGDDGMDAFFNQQESELTKLESSATQQLDYMKLRREALSHKVEKVEVILPVWTRFYNKLFVRKGPWGRP